MSIKRKLMMALVILSVINNFVLVAAGFQETTHEYPGAEGRITVYLSDPSVMLDKLESTFEQEYGDVLEFVHMGCGPLRQRIWAEMEAGMINADVFWGSDPLLSEALEEYMPEGIESLKD
ncbi:MAG: hypothetical protein JEZ04_17335 [Spirochaetales bacterium]|nr:hypothetical protein [Spirochaetales bacterium]